MSIISYKRGEGLTVKIEYSGLGSLDLATATFSAIFKRKKSDPDAVAVIAKADIDFDKTQIADNVVFFDITVTDTDITPGTYVGEVRAAFSATIADITQDIALVIAESVFS